MASMPPRLLGLAYVGKARPVPALPNRLISRGWPRLAEAQGSLEHALALKERPPERQLAEVRGGDDPLCQLHTDADDHGHPKLAWCGAAAQYGYG